MTPSQKKRILWQDRVLFGVVLLIAWQLASRAMGPYWISAPWLVVERLWTMVLNGDLWFHTRYTLGEALAGFVLSLPACLLALSLRRHPWVQAAVSSVAAIGYAVPKTALIPLFILWLGVGAASKVALVTSAIFFIVFYSTLRGIQEQDQQLLMTARVMGASEWQILRFIVWPGVVPYVFGGLRVAVPYAIAGAVVGEIISSNRGLGYLAQYGAMDFDTTLIFVALVTVMVIVVAVNGVVNLVQKRLLRWQSDDAQGGQRVVGV